MNNGEFELNQDERNAVLAKNYAGLLSNLIAVEKIKKSADLSSRSSVLSG